MDQADFEEEMALIKELQKHNIQTFSRFYKKYSPDMLILAHTILNDAELSAKAVDSIFEKLWEEKKFSYIQPPIHTYLYRAVKKVCIDIQMNR